MTWNNGKEWRKAREDGIEFKFPSGMVANIKPVGVDLFLKLGRVPDFLTPALIEALEIGKSAIPQRKTLEDEQSWIEFVDSVAELAFVHPRIVKEPSGEDEIALEDVEWGDKIALVELLGSPRRKLESFRSQPNSDVPSVGDVTGPPTVTE
jgi:hypothetical protein